MSASVHNATLFALLAFFGQKKGPPAYRKLAALSVFSDQAG